jgi:hypothetical protein
MGTWFPAPVSQAVFQGDFGPLVCWNKDNALASNFAYAVCHVFVLCVAAVSFMYAHIIRGAHFFPVTATFLR